MIKFGTGILTWATGERRSDRYGYVFLLRSGNSLTPGMDIEPLRMPMGLELGTPIRLNALVVETRQSTHIGDLFHRIYPETPEVGEVIDLGAGFYSFQNGMVGVIPMIARDTLWMNVKALYRAHEQTVTLFAEVL